MGNRISSDNLTTDQLRGLLEDLRRQDATVAITVTASHYEEYVETTVEKDRSDLHPDRRSSPKWVTCTGGCLPSGAVCGGEDQGGLLYVARTSHQGGVVPGKFHGKYKTAYVSWGGEEHEKTGCEVLVGSGLRWEAAEDGAVPRGAVPAGEDGGGSPLYVARAKVDGQGTIGKVNPRHQKHAHLPYGGKEHAVTQYEVLVAESPVTSNEPRVHRTVKQRKVETFRTEQQVPLTSCQDLTGQILLPQLTKEAPIMKVTLALEVYPMDSQSSDRLDQLKLHFASQHQNRDKIVETEAVFSMMGFKKINVGQTVTLTAHEPAFKDKAQAGFLCFGSAGVKNANVTIVKKFSIPTLHFSGHQLVPLPSDQGAQAPQPQPPSYQYPANPSAPGYPPTTTWSPPPPSDYPPQSSGYPPPPSGYPPPPSGYPSPPFGYPPQPSGYPPQPSGYPSPPSGYPPQPSGYPLPPAQAPGYPSAPPPHSQQPPGYPASPPHYQQTPGPAPQAGIYPNISSDYLPQASANFQASGFPTAPPAKPGISQKRDDDDDFEFI